MNSRRLATAAAFGAVLSFLVLHSGQVTAQEISRASFNADGSVNLPVNWREWVFVGAPLTPNALNDGEAAFQEYHNVYIEPNAYEHWKKTGQWADGTQFVKELVLLRKSEDCDTATGACFESSGQGYFPGDFAGLELKVKDKQRFAGEPANWAYFSFGHKSPPYEATAKAFPTESCNACHEANAETDWVFTQYYPVLRASKPQ